MPHDLFGDTVVRSPSRTLLRRFLTVFSIALHAVVICVVVVAQLFAIGPLPTPRRPLTFEEARMIKLMEIEVPRATRRPASGSSATVSTDAAPTEMPQSITKETGIAQVHVARYDGLEIVERGSSGLDGMITGERVLPPPPPAQPRAPVSCTPECSRRRKSSTSTRSIRRWRRRHAGKAW